MGVPNPFLPKQKPVNLQDLTAGLSLDQIRMAIEAGARFVVCQWVVSVLILTLRRSKVIYLLPGQSAAVKILPYTLLTLFMGWWGFPWGLIYTPEVVYKNLRGGKDMTSTVYGWVRPPEPRPSQDGAMNGAPSQRID